MFKHILVGVGLIGACGLASGTPAGAGCVEQLYQAEIQESTDQREQRGSPPLPSWVLITRENEIYRVQAFIDLAGEVAHFSCNLPSNRPPSEGEAIECLDVKENYLLTFKDLNFSISNIVNGVALVLVNGAANRFPVPANFCGAPAPATGG